jgi:hypothetical protein
MKRITPIRLAFSTLSLVALLGVSGVAQSTPVPNGATIETRTFNDCPLSTVTTLNNYPSKIQISDTMDPGCVGFANLHSWSFSADGGSTAAVFNNNANFRFGADIKISGPGEGEGGLRISPWYGKFVDGRFMANATTGEIACFGGRLPFYSFTGNHGITYVKGTTIHLEVVYTLAHDLFSTDPATIQYRVIYNGNTYDSPNLAFDSANPAECDPYHLWGILNDARVGGYFQPRANTGANLTASWKNIHFSVLPEVGTPVANGATVETRTFNDCPLSTLTTTNNYPAQIKISDVMDPGCVGFANLHSWSFSEDGGTSAAPFHNNSNFHFLSDFSIAGDGEGEGGLRLSPWYGKFVDGRFMANATSGEIACFGGAVPFYSFTGNHGITYTKGTTIHLDVVYRSNELVETDPGSIRYRVVYNGNTYDSPELPFGEQNAAECNPYHTWGMLNDGRAGGYFQPRANTGEDLTATWNNIRYSTCVDPIEADVDISPRKLNTRSRSPWITVEVRVPCIREDNRDWNKRGRRGGDDDDDNNNNNDGHHGDHNGDPTFDVSSFRLNGVPAATSPRPRFSREGCKVTVRFPREAVLATITPGDRVPILVSGTFGGDCFEAVQFIKVKGPRVREPEDDDDLIAGTSFDVTWDNSDGAQADYVTLLSSVDDGVTWKVEAENVRNTGSYRWRVPNVQTTQARVAVVTLASQDETGPVTSEEIAVSGPFSIVTPAGVGDAEIGFALHGAVPNPSTGLNVSFTLPNNKPAMLTVYDVSGRQVGQRDVGSLGAGRHLVSLAQKGRLPAGLYVVQLVQGGWKLSSRAVVVD